MQHRFILIILLSFCFWDGNSQSKDSFKSAINIAAGGIGGYGSLNYEHTFFSKKNYSIAPSAGFSFFRFYDYERKFNPDLLFPIRILGFRKWKSHQAVLGVGQTISSLVQANADFEKIRNNALSGSLILGYRFQKQNSRWTFQINYTPLFEHYKRFRNWGGLSVGYFLK